MDQASFLCDMHAGVESYGELDLTKELQELQMAEMMSYVLGTGGPHLRSEICEDRSFEELQEYLQVGPKTTSKCANI